MSRETWKAPALVGRVLAVELTAAEVRLIDGLARVPTAGDRTGERLEALGNRLLSQAILARHTALLDAAAGPSGAVAARGGVEITPE